MAGDCLWERVSIILVLYSRQQFVVPSRQLADDLEFKVLRADCIENSSMYKGIVIFSSKVR